MRGRSVSGGGGNGGACRQVPRRLCVISVSTVVVQPLFGWSWLGCFDSPIDVVHEVEEEEVEGGYEEEDRRW